MYFLHNDTHIITVHPSYFGKDSEDMLKLRLLTAVEGTIKDDHFIICVVNIDDPIPAGRILPGSGQAEYEIGYRAVVWKPFKGECVDGEISSVMSNGFFVEVGPLTAFVSNRMMAHYWKYDPNSSPPGYVDDQGNVLMKGSAVRIKFFGIRSEMGNMYALGSTKDSYLGYTTND